MPTSYQELQKEQPFSWPVEHVLIGKNMGKRAQIILLNLEKRNIQKNLYIKGARTVIQKPVQKQYYWSRYCTENNFFFPKQFKDTFTF